MTEFLNELPLPIHSSIKQSSIADPSLSSFNLLSEASCGKNKFLSDNPSVGGSKRKSSIPVYGKRKGWIPRTLEDFEDGGAYPEIQLAQFPANMGRGETTDKDLTVVALQTDEEGNIQYDSVVRQNLQHHLVVHTRPAALKPKWSNASDLLKPSQEEVESNEARTKAALEAIMMRKMSRGLAKSANQEPEYIKYTPNKQAPGHNANCSQRIIRMVEAQVDPMEPPKFKHKRVPRSGGSPPPPVLHSPPRKLSEKDQAAWKIPPCISNWKNQKGYTIPLDKRLQADGRSLQDISINDKFATLSEALYIAERAAREEIRVRNELVKHKKEQEELLREQQLRDLAAKARAERTSVLNKKDVTLSSNASSADNFLSNDKEVEKRMEIEQNRRREIERDIRLERAGKKSKLSRDEGRDISERIALGQAQPTAQESLFDARLFNQTAGMDSGFSGGDDEKYNIYDKPLFVDRSRDTGIYRYDKERIEKNLGFTDSDIPSFGGADSSRAPRTTPVEFEIDTEDPFGLKSLIDATAKKNV